jgi:hypothetical protein
MPSLSTSPIASTASYPLGRNIRSGSSFMILRPARSLVLVRVLLRVTAWWGMTA